MRALLVWLLMMLAESLHGVLRRLLFGPEIQLPVRQVSVAVATLIVFGIAWISLGWMKIRTTGGAVTVGLLWALMTLAFEIGLGRGLGLAWSRIWTDYDLARGGLMPLGLAAMALTPLAARRLQRWRRGER
jgi:hypothetical protein